MAKTPSKKTAKAAKATSKAAGGKKKAHRRTETVRAGDDAAAGAPAPPPRARARARAPAARPPALTSGPPPRPARAVLVVHLQGAQAGAQR